MIKISMFTYLNDENYLAVAGRDFFFIYIYNIRNFNYILVKSWRAHTIGKLTALMTLKNGDLVSGANENNIKIWDRNNDWILNFLLRFLGLT